jgi:amino acid transporter
MSEELDQNTSGGTLERRGFGDNYLRGLHASARENVSAYGYSVTITASFGLLSATEGSPRVLAIFLFAVGAILAVALVEAIASGGFRHRLEEEPSRVRALGGSISFPSVGLALAAVLLVGNLVSSLLAWPLGSFLATLVFLLIFALELGLAELLSSRSRE